MKKTLKKILRGAFNLTVITALMMNVFAGWLDVAQATVYVDQSDTMTRLQNSTAANHTVAFTLPSGIDFDVTGNTDTLRVDFDDVGGAAAFTQAGTWVPGDFAMTANNGVRTIVINAVDQAVAPNITCTVAAGADNVCIAVETDTHVFTIQPSATFTATLADQEIVFTINGTAGDGTLTNPVTNGSYKTDLAMCDEDAGPCTTTFTSTHTGSLAVSIIADDQVAVSAVVDPTITVTITGDPVALGTLSVSSVSTDTLTVQTVTNAPNGYSSTVLDDGNLRSGGNDIDDVAIAGTIDAGTEEYGISTDDTTGGPFDIIFDADCASVFNADPLTTTAQTFAGAATGPVDETATLCFAASITATTVAATYQHTLTIVSTGLF